MTYSLEVVFPIGIRRVEKRWGRDYGYIAEVRKRDFERAISKPLKSKRSSCLSKMNYMREKERKEGVVGNN